MKLFFQNKKMAYWTDILFSGIPGTTFIGSVPTTIALYRLYQKLENQVMLPSANKLREYVVENFRYFGMTLKEETLKTYKFERYPVLTEYKVLGQRLKTIETSDGKCVVNIPEEFDILVSFCLPTKLVVKDEHVRINYALQRALGLLVSGGYLFPNVYKILADFWNKYISTHNPFDEELEVMRGIEYAVEEVIGTMRVNGKWSEMMPVEFFQNIFVKPGQKFKLGDSLAKVMEPEVVLKTKVQSWADITEEEEEHKETQIEITNEQGKIILNDLPVLPPKNIGNMPVKPPYVPRSEKLEQRKIMRKAAHLKLIQTRNENKMKQINVPTVNYGKKRNKVKKRDRWENEYHTAKDYFEELRANDIENDIGQQILDGYYSE